MKFPVNQFLTQKKEVLKATRFVCRLFQADKNCMSQKLIN